MDPQFGQIEDVIIVNSVYFNVKLFHFSDHYQSYVVTLTSQFTTLTLPTTSLHFMQEPSLDLLVHLRKLDYFCLNEVLNIKLFNVTLLESTYTHVL